MRSAVRGEFPEAKIIVLTTYHGLVQILRALKRGAQAYLMKNTFHEQLVAATASIRAVHAGRKVLAPEASYEIAEHATDDALMPAESAVLRLIAAVNADKQSLSLPHLNSRSVEIFQSDVASRRPG